MFVEGMGELLVSSGLADSMRTAGRPESTCWKLPCQGSGSSLLDHLPHTPPSVSTSESGQRHGGLLTSIRENHTKPVPLPKFQNSLPKPTRIPRTFQGDVCLCSQKMLGVGSKLCSPVSLVTGFSLSALPSGLAEVMPARVALGIWISQRKKSDAAARRQGCWL